MLEARCARAPPAALHPAAPRRRPPPNHQHAGPPPTPPTPAAGPYPLPPAQDATETEALVQKEGRKCLRIAGDVGSHEVCVRARVCAGVGGRWFTGSQGRKCLRIAGDVGSHEVWGGGGVLAACVLRGSWDVARQG